MRFHWGHGIFAFIVFFFVITVAFVVWSFRQDLSLVEENYYADGLKYQEVISQKDNTDSLAEPVRFQRDAAGVWIQFPEMVTGKTITGNIMVYRPSDSKLDFSIPLQLDTTNKLMIPLSHFTKGKYTLKLAWTLNSKAYYQEENLYIP